jgi:hypothetical protein
MKRGLVVIAGLFLISACGNGHDVDQAAWKSQLRATGHTNANMAKLTDLYVNDLCKEDADKLALFLATVADGGDLDMDLERLNFKYACPGRLDTLDDAAKKMQDSGHAVDDACSTPAGQRTEDQSELAEAMGC